MFANARIPSIVNLCHFRYPGTLNDRDGSVTSAESGHYSTSERGTLVRADGCRGTAPSSPLFEKNDHGRTKPAHRETRRALGSSDATDSTVLRHVGRSHPIETSTRVEGAGDHARCRLLGSVCFESISSTALPRFGRFVPR